MELNDLKWIAVNAARKHGVMPHKTDGSEDIDEFMLFLGGIYALSQPPKEEHWWNSWPFWTTISQVIVLAMFIILSIL